MRPAIDHAELENDNNSHSFQLKRVQVESMAHLVCMDAEPGDVMRCTGML